MSEETLDYKTYKQIKQMMLRFDIVPGQRLVITELADRLGISRTPVKMALIMLMKEGFVDYSARQSCYTIHQLSREEYDGLVDFREVLETGAVYKAMKNLNATRLKQLAQKESKFRQAAEANEREERFALDLDFHTSIVSLAGSSSLTETFKDVYQRFFLQRRIIRLGADRNAQVIAEHKAITDAFRQNDPEKARQAITAHVKSAKEFFDAIYY